MRTTILAGMIVFVGLVIIATGVWGLFILGSEFISDTEERAVIPLGNYAKAIGMIAGGLGLVGLGQALRLLREIYAKVSLIREFPISVWKKMFGDVWSLFGKTRRARAPDEGLSHGEVPPPSPSAPPYVSDPVLELFSLHRRQLRVPVRRGTATQLVDDAA
jgi:hypothetical protein